MEEHNPLTVSEATTDGILDRLKDALRLRTDKELSGIFEVSTAVLSNWRKSNSLNYLKLFEVISDNRLNPSWVIYAAGDITYYTKSLQKSNIDPTVIKEMTDHFDLTNIQLDNYRNLNEKVDSLMSTLKNKGIIES